MHKTSTTDDKRLQNTLKRLSVNTIPGIEEVNIFKDDTVIHFTNPKGAAPDGRLSVCLEPPGLSSTPSRSLNSTRAPPVLKVQASIAANTYVVSGPSQTKSAWRACACALFTSERGPLTCDVARPAAAAELHEMMPGILNQLGPENMASLKRMTQQFQQAAGAGAGGDDDVPEVDTFDG